MWARHTAHLAWPFCIWTEQDFSPKQISEAKFFLTFSIKWLLMEMALLSVPCHSVQLGSHVPFHRLSRLGGSNCSVKRQQRVGRSPTLTKLDKEFRLGTSVVAQWLRIRPPMNGTLLWPLVWDSTCLRAAVCALRLLKPLCPRPCALQQERPLQWEARAPRPERSSHSPQPEKAVRSSEDPVQPKINK